MLNDHDEDAARIRNNATKLARNASRDILKQVKDRSTFAYERIPSKIEVEKESDEVLANLLALETKFIAEQMLKRYATMESVVAAVNTIDGVIEEIYKRPEERRCKETLKVAEDVVRFYADHFTKEVDNVAQTTSCTFTISGVNLGRFYKFITQRCAAEAKAKRRKEKAAKVSPAPIPPKEELQKKEPKKEKYAKSEKHKAMREKLRVPRE